MIAFPARDPAIGEQFHAAGLANGGTDKGKPGVRDYYSPDFFAAYLRDPDGNKISCFYCYYDKEKDPGG